jgi:hypothetical protein
MTIHGAFNLMRLILVARTEYIMSSSMVPVFSAVFLLVLLLVGWLKYGERVLLDRHDDSARSDRTDLPHKPQRQKPLLARLSTLGRVKTQVDVTPDTKTSV